MKPLLACMLMAFAQPAAADWYFEASLEGGAEFWTYTNEGGNVSPRRVKGNEIWITRTDAVNDLGADGSCSFDNCTITVYINGRLPRDREQVKVRFSNGNALDFQYSAGGGSNVLLSNFTTAGMAQRAYSLTTSVRLNGWKFLSVRTATNLALWDHPKRWMISRYICINGGRDASYKTFSRSENPPLV